MPATAFLQYAIDAGAAHVPPLALSRARSSCWGVLSVLTRGRSVRPALAGRAAMFGVSPSAKFSWRLPPPISPNANISGSQPGVMVS